MSDKTGIEWTDATWNPIAGCSIVSPACTNCYAMAQAARIVRCAAGLGRATHYADTVTTVKGKPVWTGEIRAAPDHVLTQPMRWRRPRRIFVNSMSDLFHEAVPDTWIDRIFAVMALAPQHTFQVLTKRPERMRDYIESMTFRRLMDVVPRGKWPISHHQAMATLDPATTQEHRDLYHVECPGLPLPNVWLGVTAENQRMADERIPVLLDTAAAKRFVSIEPMLGKINLESWLDPAEVCEGCDDGYGFGGRCKSDRTPRDEQCPWNRAVQVVKEHGPYDAGGAPASVTSTVMSLDWVICGGESGPDARPMHPDWVRSIRDQCAAAGTPFMMKQWGEWMPQVGARDGIDDSQEQSRYRWAEWTDRWGTEGDHRWNYVDYPQWCDEMDPHHSVVRVGKRAAGRLLDGVEHNAFPGGV